MTLVLAAMLGCAVLSAWLATMTLLWVHGALDRLHLVSAANVACGIPTIVAALVTDGASSRFCKCALILLALTIFGALMSHVTGRAVHLREGERQ